MVSDAKVTKILQIRLGHYTATPHDELGRSHVGAYPGISPEEAWDAARGFWQIDPTRLLAQDEIVVTDPEGIILAAVTITGVLQVEGGTKRYISGSVVKDDPRVGTPTPTPNPARNAIHYRVQLDHQRTVAGDNAPEEQDGDGQ